MSKVSVIVTSYNQSATLELLLASLERQTYREFEVVIADDGSSDSTAELCGSSRGFPVRWVTQADEGYRKSRILNRAIAQSSAEYLVFLDADVVLERHFLADHIALRQPGAFVCGRRVDLGPELTRALLAGEVHMEHPLIWGSALLKSAWRGDTQNFKRALRVTSGWLRRILKYDRPIDLLGSNFGVWKSDLVAVNGFNEALESYWGEDGDLFVRLRNAHKAVIGAKSLCIQYHLYHPRRIPTAENVAFYEKLLSDHQYVRAERGFAESVARESIS